MDECKPLPVGSFTMQVLDGAGNLMGADDRYSTYTGYTVSRAVRCSSATVTLAGVTEANTNGTGVASFPGLTLVRPAAGRGLHSSTFQLNLSALYGIGGARRGCVARVKGVSGGVEGVLGGFLCQTRLKLS